MTLRSLTRSDIMDLADEQIFYRGADYCNSGRVYKFSLSGNRITAKVQGNYGDYTVKISEDRRDPDELEWSCNCPYDDDICKHIVAVLLHSLKTKPKEAESVGADIPSAVKQTLESMSREDLIRLMFELADEADEFRRALIAKVVISPEIINELPENPKLVKKLKKQISVFFEEMEEQSNYGDDYRYRNYADGDDDSPELDSVYETAKSLNPFDQCEVYMHIVKCGNDHNEEFAVAEGEIEKAFALYGDAVKMQQLEHKFKRPYLDRLFDASKLMICEAPPLSTALKDALDKICTEEADYRYVIEKLEKNDHREAEEWLASFYLKIGDDKNYLKIRRENLETEDQFIDLALYWKSKGNDADFADVLEEWAVKLSQKRGESYWEHRYSKPKGEGVLSMLADHYRSRKDNENLLRILMTTIRYGNFDLELYKNIESVGKKLKRWEELRSEAIDYAESRPELLADIRLYEKDWEAAIKLAEATEHYDRMKIKIAEAVKKKRPEDAIEIYRRLVEAQIDKRSRESYRIAAEHAKSIKSIYQDVLKNAAAWREYVGDVRSKYKRLPALQDEFRDL